MTCPEPTVKWHRIDNTQNMDKLLADVLRMREEEGLIDDYEEEDELEDDEDEEVEDKNELDTEEEEEDDEFLE